MTPDDQAAAQKLLKEVTESLRALDNSSGDGLDEKRSELFRRAISLRRQLSIDGDSLERRMQDFRHAAGRGTPAPDVEPEILPAAAQSASIIAEQSAETAKKPCSFRLPCPAQIADCSLNPVTRLVIGGIFMLAWVIQPAAHDPALAVILLMFLRFVPLFVIGGSLCGRTGVGTIVGIGMFFALMGAESLSLLMWDGELTLPEVNRKLVRHAGDVSRVLYVLGAVGLFACVATAVALRGEQHNAYAHYLRLSLHVLVAVQLALVAELAYTSLRHFTGVSGQEGMLATVKVLQRKTSRH
jgi:hypothetical protein